MRRGECAAGLLKKRGVSSRSATDESIQAEAGAKVALGNSPFLSSPKAPPHFLVQRVIVASSTEPILFER